TTILILPCSPAPKAWPISTVAPVLRPMTKAKRKNITGKNTDTAASASTPIIWPRNTLLTVPNSDCKALLSINGARKTRNVFQMGGDFDTAFPAGGGVTDRCRAPMRGGGSEVWDPLE